MTSRLLVSSPLWAAKRTLSAQAAAATKAVGAGGNQEALVTHITQKEARETRLYVIAFGSQVSKAENGLTLVSVDNGAPVATLGVVVKAGAR